MLLYLTPAVGRIAALLRRPRSLLRLSILRAVACLHCGIVRALAFFSLDVNFLTVGRLVPLRLLIVASLSKPVGLALLPLAPSKLRRRLLGALLRFIGPLLRFIGPLLRFIGLFHRVVDH